MSTAPQTTEFLRPGQRLNRDEFMRRWEAMPDLKFAELIDGVVYMPSPQTSDHGRLELKIDAWLGTYIAGTPGCDGGTQSTWLMLQSAPQPDSYLWIVPECGGQSRIKGKYHTGAPELAVEVCYTSAAYDLGVKKALYQEAQVRESRSARLAQPNSRGIYRSSIFPGLWLDARALWKHDLPRLLQTLQRGLNSAEHTAFVQSLACKRS